MKTLALLLPFALGCVHKPLDPLPRIEPCPPLRILVRPPIVIPTVDPAWSREKQLEVWLSFYERYSVVLHGQMLAYEEIIKGHNERPTTPR